MIPTEMGAIDLGQGMLSGGNLRTDRPLYLWIILDLEGLCHNILHHVVSTEVKRVSRDGTHEGKKTEIKNWAICSDLFDKIGRSVYCIFNGILRGAVCVVGGSA